MAAHTTKKSTAHGKATTASRKADRARKYAGPGLDIDRLTAELHREQAQMERANREAR